MLNNIDSGCDDNDASTILTQEKQLKKVRAKQKRLQAILGGEDTQRVEAELLAEDDGEEGEVSLLLMDGFSIFHQQYNYHVLCVYCISCLHACIILMYMH